MKIWRTHLLLATLCISAVLIVGAAERAQAYEVTLSLYNQGFNINNFYNDGDFDVEAGMVEADPSSLLVIVGDPANVEETLEVPEIPDPFELAEAGSDFHFEEFQPFRFQDRFDGLFSTTVDDPVLFTPDNGAVTNFRDDGLLADDRIDLAAYEADLPEPYFEVDWGDTITMQTTDGTNLYITRVWRNPDYTVTFDISNVPEPGTLVLLGLGLVGILGIVRRKRGKTNVKKVFPVLMFALVVLLTTMFYSVNTYAYEIGPDFCAYSSQAICTQFQEAYHPDLGQPISPATGFVSNWTQKFENGYITCDAGGCAGYSQAQDPAEVAIMQKWREANNRGVDLGNPTKEVVDAWGSPYGTTGKVRFFERGDIYYLTSGPNQGKAFFVTGAIKAVYDRNYDFGSGGWLGFPVTDEYIDPSSGYAINQFEGGCITTDDGIAYSERPKSECPPIPDFSQPTQLVSVECRDCCIELDNSKHELSRDEFIYNFDPYHPLDYTLRFEPEILNFPISDRTMVRDVNVTVNMGKYGSKDASVTIVNPDISWGMSPVGFDLKFKKKMKEMTKAFDTIEETTNKFKRFDLTTCQTNWQFDPSLSFGFEGSKLCCPTTSYCIKDGLRMYLDFSADFGPISCDIPVFPLPFGFRANLAFDAGLGTSLQLAKKPSCESHDDICGDVEARFDVGLGASLTDITGGKLLKGSLKGKPNPSFGAKTCTKTNDLLAWRFDKARACIAPRVVGEVKIASFIKKSISLSVGGKRCKTWE